MNEWTIHNQSLLPGSRAYLMILLFVFFRVCFWNCLENTANNNSDMLSVKLDGLEEFTPWKEVELKAP